MFVVFKINGHPWIVSSLPMIVVAIDNFSVALAASGDLALAIEGSYESLRTTTY